jgi:hypothetical protein
MDGTSGADDGLPLANKLLADGRFDKDAVTRSFKDFVEREAISWQSDCPDKSARDSSLASAKANLERALSNFHASGRAKTDAEALLADVFEIGISTLAKVLTSSDLTFLLSLSTTTIAKSMTISQLGSIRGFLRRAAHPLAGFLTRGGGLVGRVLGVIESELCDQRRTADEVVKVQIDSKAARLHQLVLEFGETVCGKALGIADPFGECVVAPTRGMSHTGSEEPSPLSVAAFYGQNDLVSGFIARGASANGSFHLSSHQSPILQAMKGGHLATFKLLVEEGADLLTQYKGDMLNALQCILSNAWVHPSTPEQKSLYRDMLSALFEARPEVARAKWVAEHKGSGACEVQDVLSLACVCSVEAVEFALEHGCKPSVRKQRARSTITGREGTWLPTIGFPLFCPNLEILKLLLNHGAMQDWKDTYDAKGMGQIARMVCRLAAGCYPQNESFSSEDNTLPYDKSNNDVLDLFLRETGFNHAFISGGANVIFTQTLNCDCETDLFSDSKSYRDVVARLHNSGFNVKSISEKNVGTPLESDIHVIAAKKGWAELLEYALTELGCNIDARGELGTPFTACLQEGRLETAMVLIERYGAAVVYPQSSPKQQPVIVLLASSILSDEDSLQLLQKMVAKDKALLDLTSYRTTGPANPIAVCIMNSKLKCLEWMLQERLPGVEALCCSRCPGQFPLGPSYPSMLKATAAFLAAFVLNWPALELILRHTSVSVTEDHGIDFGKFKQMTAYRATTKACVVDMVIEQAREPSPISPPRSLVALVLARAQEERKAAKEEPKGSSSQAPTPSNAFEEPRIRPVLSADEEKKRAKRRAQKKKAKAKKRAAAGAGVKEGDVSDSDSSGTDEEEKGMDEEERMLARAPTFDLEKERAARKAVREKEAEEEAGCKLTGTTTN